MLQEFDLPRGVTIIGRSVDCHLTIEDPLVSRRHARLIVDDDGARVEDLSSRNGLRINGLQVRAATALRSGDRVRIGTQELVFTQVDAPGRSQARTTGQLRLCASCRQPYPREMVACPACEATEQTDEETLTATGNAPQQWSVQLFVEALERALRLGRSADAERMARRAMAQVDELVGAGAVVDFGAIMALASLAVETTAACDDPAFAVWALDIYGRSRRVPPLPLLERLGGVAERHRGTVAAQAARLLETVGPDWQISPGDAEGLARLRAMANVTGRVDLAGMDVGARRSGAPPIVDSDA